MRRPKGESKETFATREQSTAKRKEKLLRKECNVLSGFAITNAVVRLLTR